MRSTTPHIGAEPSVGPKTVVVGFPRVVVECLLALTERARGGAAAVEGMTVSGGTFLRGVQGNPNKFPILVQGDAAWDA